MLARPHVLALPIMVAWAAALVRAMDARLKPPYWALPLIVLWANLHGSVVLGLGLIGPAVLEALIEDWRAWPRILWRWLPFSALAVLAACLTPYGPGSLLVPLTTLGLGHALTTIVEWRPQDFGHFGTFEFLLLIGIFALSRGVKVPLVRMLVLLGLLHFALAQVRNTDLLAMLAPLYLAAPLARQFKPAHAEEPAPHSAMRSPRRRRSSWQPRSRSCGRLRPTRAMRRARRSPPPISALRATCSTTIASAAI